MFFDDYCPGNTSYLLRIIQRAAKGGGGVSRRDGSFGPGRAVGVVKNYRKITGTPQSMSKDIYDII